MNFHRVSTEFPRISMHFKNHNKIRKVLLAVLPGIIVAGVIFSANIYYDLDLGRIIVEQITRIVGMFETTATTTLATISGYVGIKTATPTEALTVAGNILATGNLTISAGKIFGANAEELWLGVSDDIVNVIRGGSSYIVCDSSGNCVGGLSYIGGSGTAGYIPKFSTTSTLSNSIITDDGLLVTISGQLQTIGTTTLSTTTVSRLTISELTQGSILFAGDNRLITQDNSNLYWDNTNKRLGIGTSTPEYTLDLVGTLRAGNVTLGGGSLIWSVTNNPSGDDSANSVAVDSTGIYVVGFDYSPGNYQWRIEKRSLNDGSLIWATTSNPSSGSDVAYSVAVDSTGIYVVGYDRIPGNYQWRIEKRSLNDGSLIWSVTSNPSSGYDEARSLALDSTGIYVVGWDVPSGNVQWRIEKRSLNDGSLIWATTTNPSSGSDGAYSVAVDSTGIYVVGYDNIPGNYQWRIEKRSLNDGSLIWSVTSNPSSGSDAARSVAVDSTGIYVVGYDSIPGNEQWRIEKRSLNDGSLIWATTTNPSSYDDNAYSVTVDSTGIYVVGYDETPGSYQWRIEKRSLNDGSLIWSVTSDPSSDYDSANSVTVDSTGIYVVGYDSIPGNAQWRIEKRRKYDENKPLITVVSNNNVLTKLDVLGTALIRGNEGNDVGLYVNEYGYVGIGTNNPSNFIEVKDLIKFLGTNTFLGFQSGYSNTTGYSNVGIGYQALYSNLTGSENIAIGSEALRSSTSSSYNIALGSSALYNNTTGENNVGIGYQALYSNLTGSENIAIGNSALYYSTSSSYNIAFGNYALYYNRTGSANVVMGYYAGLGAWNTSYSSSTIIGYGAGYSNSGSGNILIGYQAGDNITTGNRNIIIGYDIDAPSSTASYQLNIGNIIFGTNIDGTGTTISSGNIGIGTTTPPAKLTVSAPGTAEDGVLISIATTSSSYYALNVLSEGTSRLYVRADGNIGIGTTTPAYKLDVEGDIRATGYVRGDTGLCIGSDCRTAWPSGGTGDVYWIQSGNYLYPSSTDWYVGIGTTTPSHKLTVSGTLFVSETSTLANLLPISDITYSLGSPTFRWANIYAATATIGSTIIIGSNTIEGTATTTLFTTNNTNQLVLATNGNIGIGTTTPPAKLTVSAAGTAEHGVLISIATTSSSYYALNVLSGGTSRLYVRADGNVGIGTANPTQLLHLKTSNINNLIRFETTIPGGGGETSSSTNNGGTFASDCSNGSYNEWSNPQYAQYSDDNRASSYVWSDYTCYLKATNFGFNIPTDATINGVLVRIEKSAAGSGSVYDYQVYLVVGGSPSGNNKANTTTSWPSSDQYFSYGGSNDTWGLSLTPSQVNSSDFGVVISAESWDDEAWPYIDHIEITVYYTTSSSSTSSDWVIGVASSTSYFHLSKSSNIGTNDYFTVATSGDVGIGTTTPAYRLDVGGTIRQTNALNCALNADAEGALVCQSSSQRYKINIQDLNFDINKFLSLNPRSFEWNLSTINFVPGEKGSVGFVAEEVEKEFPDLVRYKDGQPEGVKYEILPVYLFKVVKDLILGFTEKVKLSLHELGVAIEEGMVKIEKLFVKEIEIDNAKIKEAEIERLRVSKVEMVDQVTGEIYCAWIENGEWKKLKGECKNMTTNEEIITNEIINNEIKNNETKNNEIENNEIENNETITNNDLENLDNNEQSANEQLNNQQFHSMESQSMGSDPINTTNPIVPNNPNPLTLP